MFMLKIDWIARVHVSPIQFIHITITKSQQTQTRIEDSRYQWTFCHSKSSTPLHCPQLVTLAWPSPMDFATEKMEKRAQGVGSAAQHAVDVILQLF